MRDNRTQTDEMQTDKAPIREPSVSLDLFRRCADLELFCELKENFERQGQLPELAELLELQARRDTDPRVRALRWFDAGDVRLRFQDEGGADAAYFFAVRSDASFIERNEVYLQRLIAQKRYADAIYIARLEVDTWDEGDDEVPHSHRVARYRMLATLWEKELGRLDEALRCWQSLLHIDPTSLEALQRSQEICRALGGTDEVISLFEAELSIVTDPKRQAKVEFELGRLREGEPTAEAHFERALALDPGFVAASEALAELLSAKTDEAELERAATVFVDLADSLREEGQEQEQETIGYLRRALAAKPGFPRALARLEALLTSMKAWEELEELYLQEEEMCSTDSERAERLVRRLELYDGRVISPIRHKECLGQLAVLHPPGNEYTQVLRELLEAEGDSELLSRLLQSEITNAQSSEVAVPLLLELATVYRERLKDNDSAAEALHRALSLDPLNQEAITRYAGHFRERRDWRGLADLDAYIADQLQANDAPPYQIVAHLESIAELSELRLGDVERAIATWRKIEELEGPSSKTRGMLQRLSSRTKVWQSLVGVLEKEANEAASGPQRAEALRRIAQTYRERQVNPRQAIALYEEVLTYLPGDAAALKALSEMYERDGDEAGLAHTIRRQLDLEMARMTADDAGPGANPRDWPVAKRVERVTSLRRLATMYETHLADVEGVMYACSGIIEILPGDRVALERMERVLEKAQDYPRLEQTLEYHVASSTAPVERTKLLRRLAQLAQERNDSEAALSRWEQLLQVAPNDPEALQSLAEMYEAMGRYVDLAEVLERSIADSPTPQPGSSTAALLAGALSRLAAVVTTHLHDSPRAIGLWRRVLAVSELDRGALHALTNLYRDRQDWVDLAELLARQIPLYIEDQPNKAADLALERAILLEEHLGAPEQAIAVLTELVSNLRPRDVEAHRRLRRLCEQRGSFERAIRLAEREILLIDDVGQKVHLALEVGRLCRDHLADPRRALYAYERVLEWSPKQEEALLAVAELYARLACWSEYVGAMERTLECETRPVAQQAIALQIAEVVSDKLEDPVVAFSWYTRAHEAMPTAETREALRSLAKQKDLWPELVAVYEGERERFTPGGEHQSTKAYLAVTRDLASVYQAELQAPERAVELLREALLVDPMNEDLLAQILAIGASVDSEELWMACIRCLDLPLAASKMIERLPVYLKRAKLREERLHDLQGAREDLLQAFSIAPYEKEIHRALYAFGERHGDWQEVLTFETALAQAVPKVKDKIRILRRQADALENHADNKVGAFRTLISAFILSPDDSEILDDLWRLADAIGEYDEADQTPERRKPAAHIISATELRGPVSAVHGTAGTKGIPHRMHLPGTEAVETPSRTEELDLSEVLSDDSEAFHELQSQTNDLVEAFGSSRPSGFEATVVRERGALGNGPPPPPPPRPRIGHRADASRLQPKKRAIFKKNKERRLPVSPRRPYSSPWSELAYVYTRLPAKDAEQRLRWCHRAAQVWESGAKNIERAFDVLAAALEKYPNSKETRERLLQLASTHNEWDRLAELYLDVAEVASSLDAAAEFLLCVADIRKRQGRLDETENLFRRILGMRPTDNEVRSQIEELYRGQERWIDLAALLEEHTDPRLHAGRNPSTKAQLRELAALYRSKLDRPRDAIETLERLLTLEPSNVDLLVEIADLYEEVGRFSKVVETLTRVCDIADGQPPARAALLRIGDVYDKELGLPERAISAYATLVTQWPDDSGAFSALQRLYEQSARWEELSLLLRQRSTLERDPRIRAGLLHRCAKISLQWLSRPEDAVAALRLASSLVPDDGDIMNDLVVALTAAGRHREAIAMLQGQIARLKENKGADGDIAALLIRLAALRSDTLGDATAAREALEEALISVPGHPTALAELSKLADAEHDPLAYAEARLREANAVSDPDAKVEALLEAGKGFCAVGDLGRARKAYQTILSLRPFHSGATWALAALVEEAGEATEAVRLLTEHLERASLEPREQSAIQTQLAALSRQLDVPAAAEQYLREALATCPEFIPAIMGLSDLYAEAERWTDLESFLVQALPDLSCEDTKVSSELYRRLAIAYEGLGRVDEAYQTLLQADRLHRNSLLVKLALGQNRYRARRWREASLHLSSLADHSEACNHPHEVARGLYHAALAEIRSKRPERAEPLYNASLALKPNFAPALHALGELAMERGDVELAMDYLVRQADATEEPKERLRLFETLGDAIFLQLHDSLRARDCYASAVAAASPLDASHVSLLQKLLERQLVEEDLAGAGRSCELLASFLEESVDKCDMHKTAARHFVAAGMPKEALTAASLALRASANDLDACDLVSRLALQENEAETAHSALSRVLNHYKSTGSQNLAKDQLALLWSRLGDAREMRGDAKGSIAAYEMAIDLGPTSEGAMRARRALLAKEVPVDSEQAVEARRILAAHSLAQHDVVDYARSLLGAGNVDGARQIFEVARVLGYKPVPKERDFLSAHPPKKMAEDEAYRCSLSEDARASLFTDPDDQPLARISSIIWQCAALLWPNVQVILEQSGVEGAERIADPGRLRVAAVFTRIARALAVPATILYVTEAEDAPVIQVVCGSPATVVFSRALLEARDVPDSELRFLLARAAEFARPERVLAKGLGPDGFERLVESVWRTFGPNESMTTDERQDVEDEQLRTTLLVSARRELRSLLAGLTEPPAVSHFVRACERVADRAGLLICGDIETAVAMSPIVANGGVQGHLVATVLSPQYLSVRKALGVAIS